jgi:glyoxylase-like metal-dependent hydrolase (beta-lactamase superfamily II)
LEFSVQANLTRKIGNYELTILIDGIFEDSADVLIHAGGDAARKAVIDNWGDTKVRMDVNCFVLRGPNGISLIDAGVGKEGGETFGGARRVLAEMGIEPAHIDRVLLTHIHGDHALGLLDGDVPWLPRAKILIPEADLAFFTDKTARQSLSEDRGTGFDITERLLHSYSHRITPIAQGPVPDALGINALPLPGHTPGHSGYLLQGAGEDLLIWADTVHLCDAQLADPDIGLIYDTDPQTARQTRRALLHQVSSEGWLVAGSHIAGINRVVRKNEGFEVMPEERHSNS